MSHHPKKLLIVSCLLLAASLWIAANAQSQEGRADRRAGRQDGQRGGRARSFPAPQSAWKVGSILLGCPTDKSIEMVIHPSQDLEGFVQYGKAGGSLDSRTPLQAMKAAAPLHVRLEGLQPNTAYSYSLNYRTTSQDPFRHGPSYSFQTQRSSGVSFSFYVQGDSHPERMPKMNDPALYERTLVDAAKHHPDFYICLGDDFSVDTLPERTPQAIEFAYLKQVPYLGLVGSCAPLFLVNGNHEQAALANLDGSSNSLGVLVQNARNRNFPQPAPDSFYTGNSTPVEHIGLLRNYFAWNWGDAMFIVIDPYWHSSVAVDNRADGGGKRRDLWQVTLGADQYRWLKKTLEQSKSKYKFVFAHHVLGTGRGGIERAPYFEWGGRDSDGSWQFGSKRPGWALPIHQLMADNHVNIFFQGHDHIFAKQVLDGVTYQTAPVPGDSTYALMNEDAYLSGIKMPGSGALRVTVGPSEARVEYVRSWLPKDENAQRHDGEVAHSYAVAPSR